MADNGAGSAISSILSDWSNIGNLFVAFVIAGLVPVLKYFGKKYEKHKERVKKEEREEIESIAKEVQKPVMDKMTNFEELMGKYTEQNEAILERMDFIAKLFHTGNIDFSKFSNNNMPGKTRGRPKKSSHFDHGTDEH